MNIPGKFFYNKMAHQAPQQVGGYMKHILALAAFLLPVTAFAGYGAIAYNPQTGQVVRSEGYMDLYTAEQTALDACQNVPPYEPCQIMNWENNQCIALVAVPGVPSEWARSQGNGFEGSGFVDPYSADQAALNACASTFGAQCVVLRTACN